MSRAATAASASHSTSRAYSPQRPPSTPPLARTASVQPAQPTRARARPARSQPDRRATCRTPLDACRAPDRSRGRRGRRPRSVGGGSSVREAVTATGVRRDRGQGPDQALRGPAGRRRPQLHRAGRLGDRLPRAERRRQVDDDAAHARARLRGRDGHLRRPALPRAGRAAAGGRRAARGQGVPPDALGAQPPADAGRGRRHPRRARRRGAAPSSGSRAWPRKKPKGFSLGMAQRLGLAAALLGDPRVLILDEPANGLDPQGITWLRGFLQSYAAAGRAVLVSSHLLSEMALMADHLVVIGQGRLISDAPVADFISRSSLGAVVVRGPEPQRLTALLQQRGATVTAEPDGRARRRRDGAGRGRRGRLRRRPGAARAEQPGRDPGAGVPRGDRRRPGPPRRSPCPPADQGRVAQRGGAR